MRVEYFQSLHNTESSQPSLGPAILTIGFFDGVHVGHQRLIARTAELAREQQAQAIAVTFWPAPASVVRPDANIQLLSTLEEKLTLLGNLGHLDITLVMPFDTSISNQSPEAFMDMLASVCQPLILVEGTDFAVGHKRAGDVAYLQRLGEQRGFQVESYEVYDDAERVSSTRIRTLVQAGTLETATRLLGRSYTLVGEVVIGDQRGRLLGFPTANLRTDARKVLPANGVYAVRVKLPGEMTTGHLGVCNVGVRPTFGGELRLMVEVYLMDGGMDLYGLHIGVDFVARLREERRFDGIETLKAQIAADAEQARKLLTNHEL